MRSLALLTRNISLLRVGRQVQYNPVGTLSPGEIQYCRRQVISMKTICREASVTRGDYRGVSEMGLCGNKRFYM